MIGYYITRASDDYWYDIRYFNSLEILHNWIDKEAKDPIIIKENRWYKEDPIRIADCIEVNNTVAETISKIKYNILIYDYYIE